MKMYECALSGTKVEIHADNGVLVIKTAEESREVSYNISLDINEVIPVEEILERIHAILNAIFKREVKLVGFEEQSFYHFVNNS